MEPSKTCGSLVPGVNEDSVDIYDDLDISVNNYAEKSSSDAQLKESMDLYEEIVTEEQRSRESTYSELKSRFQAAQNQIKELRRRLEQVEIQNTGLNTENSRLKKNICALLQTARQEVTRKDAEIQRLNQLSHKDRHHHHQSRINNLWEKNSSSQAFSGSCKNRPPPPPPSSLPLLPTPPPSSLPPPPPPPCSPPPPPPLPPLPSSPPREDQPPQPSRTENDGSTHQPIETRALKASSHSYSKSSSRRDCDVPEKQTEHSVSKSSSCSSSRHSESDRHKSKHREKKTQKLSESTDRRHRSGSDPKKDCNASDKNKSHKSDKDAARRFDSRSCQSRSYLNVAGHHKSERAKSPSPEMLRSAASSKDKMGRSRERKEDNGKISTLDSEHSTTHSCKEGYSRDHRKIKISDGHIRSSDTNDREKSSSSHHAERHSDSPKEREGDKPSKDYQRKGDRRHDGGFSRKHKRSIPCETSREQKSKESGQGKVDISRMERKEKTQEALKRSSKEPYITEKSSLEENSPNRKLCFMETLNLTISPIKKPLLPVCARLGDPTSVDKIVEKGHDDESSQPDVEDMCVIDELDSSELEAELEDSAIQPPDTSKTCEKLCGHVKIIQQKDKNQSEALASDKQLDNNPVQPTSAQPLDPVENQLTEHVTLKSSESCSPKDGDTSKNPENKSRLTSDSQAVECGPLEGSHSLSNMSGCRFLQKVNPGNNMDQSVSVAEPAVLDSSVEMKCRTPGRLVQRTLPVDDAASLPSRENPIAEDVHVSANPHKETAPTIIPQCSQQGPSPPASSSFHKKHASLVQDGPKDAEAVSSTISLESLPQEGLSLPEAIYVLTQTNKDANDSSSITSEPSSSNGCIAVSKVSSTTEETALPEKYDVLPITPKKSFCPGKSHEPSSSVPLLHDEDSMMRTLSNLKRIPDAISPLRSPIRIAKRTHLQVYGKPGHVKSLQKDFSSTAVNVNPKTLDVNKENKYPGSPANHDAQNVVDSVSDVPSSLSDTELEEGEIVSESDEAAAGSPAPAAKRATLSRPVRNKPSPKYVLKRTSEERGIASKEAVGVSTRSPKSRFKTVCPAAIKGSFSTIEEVMETFKLVRAEIRKKYMKLHKTFPRKSFYGVMDNFQESFIEFVDGAHFDQICSHEGELKSKLKKLIVPVFSKVANNGIVKRIFEQQAVDLKQKLWDFVDVQVDYLLKDIYTVLKNVCKVARTHAEDNRPSGNETASRQPTAKKPHNQQKEAGSAPASLNRIKSCAVVPYKTGLGSRGKDIRITHLENDRNVDLHPMNCRNAQTVANFFPPKTIPLTPDKSNTSSLGVSQNGSVLDKTDFELLTEQQASSLTFNLVRDSQMGEIFKCLLQGSDLLETSGITGDNTSWPFGTPRKDGERLLSINTPAKCDSPSKLLSPTKFDTPSKLIATWSTISPRKISSPRCKEQILLDPALFDESCLLEVPSESRVMLQSRSYSILAEDLAVSLTVPSPLKSDSHLSFLQPSSSSMHIMSTPDSVVSAHISEDALLDGEDATEQDIHLALDTDLSSCGSSSSSVASELATPFVFKPDLPMQALVMEKSNDHFIVRIRQAATGVDTTLTANDTLSRTLTEEDVMASGESQVKAVSSKTSQDGTSSNSAPSENNLSNNAEASGVYQANSGGDISLTPYETSTLTENPSHKKEEAITQPNTSKVCFSKASQEHLPKMSPLDDNLQNDAQSTDQFWGQISQEISREGSSVIADESASQTRHSEDDPTTQQSIPKDSENSAHNAAESSETHQKSQVLGSQGSDSERDEIEMSGSERSLTIAQDVSSTPEKDQWDCGKSRKRKKQKVKSNKSKRPRKEEEEEEEEEEKEEESTEEMVSNCKNDFSESRSPPENLSPTNLSAKNVVRKKGEVVMSWSRDEDRAILIDLKTKGASRDTFSALSEKLNKPSGQIAQRFYQLMKLFKKQEKMDP